VSASPEIMAGAQRVIATRLPMMVNAMCDPIDADRAADEPDGFGEGRGLRLNVRVILVRAGYAETVPSTSAFAGTPSESCQSAFGPASAIQPR
jgi:hypothetical protein